MGGIISQNSDYTYLFVTNKHFYAVSGSLVEASFYRNGLDKLTYMSEMYKLVGPKELTVWRS